MKVKDYYDEMKACGLTHEEIVKEIKKILETNSYWKIPKNLIGDKK